MEKRFRQIRRANRFFWKCFVEMSLPDSSLTLELTFQAAIWNGNGISLKSETESESNQLFR